MKKTLTEAQERMMERVRREGVVPLFMLDKRSYKPLKKAGLLVECREKHPRFGPHEGYVVRLAPDSENDS